MLNSSSQLRLIGYPRMVRAGLGHKLSAWARCFVWCKDNGVSMLAPRWFDGHVGPYIRREREKRLYHRLFTNEGYVTGIRRLVYLATARRFDEGDAAAALADASGGRKLVVFYEWKNVPFIYGRQLDLRQELLRITHPRYVADAKISVPFIGMHVRRGDFSEPASVDDLRAGRTNVRTPIEWYVHALKSVRSSIGMVAPVRLFTDGEPNELEPLLREPKVTLMPVRAAITDMMGLSQARALIGSGSGFCFWAAFFGQMPTLWHTGQLIANAYHAPVERARQLELEWEPGQSIPTAFTAEVLERWSAQTSLP